MQNEDFLDRIMKHLPDGPVDGYYFDHWSHADRPTEEGIGVLAVPGADPDKVLARVLDFDSYVGNIPHVEECRAVADPSVPAPGVRFYQRINIPVIGSVHHELVMERCPEAGGYEVARWRLLGPQTDALSKKDGIRSEYNDGVWLVAPGVVGYGLSSAPRRADVGFLKWKALTVGADAAASKVVRSNIEAMAAWAARG